MLDIEGQDYRVYRTMLWMYEGIDGMHRILFGIGQDYRINWMLGNRITGCIGRKATGLQDYSINRVFEDHDSRIRCMSASRRCATHQVSTCRIATGDTTSLRA